MRNMNDKSPFACPIGEFTGIEPSYGMTLRDLYGAFALQGYLANAPTNTVTPSDLENVWSIVDMFLKARDT